MARRQTPEYYTRTLSFQLLAFAFTRGWFFLAGFIASSLVVAWRRADGSAYTAVAWSAVIFAVCEVLAQSAWGR